MAGSGNSPNWAEVASAGAAWVALVLSGIACVFTLIQQQSISDANLRIDQTQSAIAEQTNHIAETQVAISNLIIPSIKVNDIQMDSRSPDEELISGSQYLNCTYIIRLANDSSSTASIIGYEASVNILDNTIEIKANDRGNADQTQIIGNTEMRVRSFSLRDNEVNNVPFFSANAAFAPDNNNSPIRNSVFFPLQVDANTIRYTGIDIGFEAKTQSMPDVSSGYIKLNSTDNNQNQAESDAVPIQVAFSFKTVQKSITSDPVVCGYARAAKLAP